MFQQTLISTIQKLVNFFCYAKSYIERNNMFVVMINQAHEKLRDFLTAKKKRQIAQYRVNYQKYRLKQMENLIASANEHTFFKGKKIDRLR